MATSEKKRVRIKATSTNQGGRPRTDLVDPFSNELIVGKVPKAKDGSLINDVAKDQWQETCKLLISRKQLKRNHLPIVLSMCNANGRKLVNYLFPVNSLNAITYRLFSVCAMPLP